MSQPTTKDERRTQRNQEYKRLASVKLVVKFVDGSHGIFYSRDASNAKYAGNVVYWTEKFKKTVANWQKIGRVTDAILFDIRNQPDLRGTKENTIAVLKEQRWQTDYYKSLVVDAPAKEKMPFEQVIAMASVKLVAKKNHHDPLIDHPRSYEPDTPIVRYSFDAYYPEYQNNLLFWMIYFKNMIDSDPRWANTKEAALFDTTADANKLAQFTDGNWVFFYGENM